MPVKYDYEAAKAFYIDGGWRQGISLLDAAVEFNIPYQTLRRRAASERWRLLREWQAIDPDECETVDEYIHYYK